MPDPALGGCRLALYWPSRSTPVTSANCLRSRSWKLLSRAAAAVGAGRWWCQTWPLRVASGLSSTASQVLGEVALFEVVDGGGAAHAGGHPAGVDGVADDVWPAAGDGEGERGDEEFAVAVGLGAVPAAGGPVGGVGGVVAAAGAVAGGGDQPGRPVGQPGR